MSPNYSGRLAVVAVFFFGALALIFSPVLEKAFHPKEPITRWVNLKPGIDMVGGTSLVYQIKAPPGGKYDPELATKVSTALKRRVDPLGQMNLIWRPEGADRLEIQLPTSGTGGAEARVKQQQFLAAQAQLQQTSVSLSEVIDSVEQKNGHTHADLARLAQGDKTRLDLFQQMVNINDQIQAIHKKPVNERDPLAEGKLHQDYLQLQVKVQETNLDVERLRDELSDPKTRKAFLSRVLQQNGDFPARIAAINQYASAEDAYQKVRSALDDTTDLKRMLQGSGVLEFHILVSPAETPAAMVADMSKRMQPGGPGPSLQAGDNMRWFELDPSSTDKYQGFYRATWNNKTYILAWITPDKSLDHREGQKRWALQSAYPTQDQNQEAVVGFTFDSQGAVDFGKLTGANVGKPMAIILDGKMISAPTINSQITNSGIITGGENGFSRTELDYLVNTLSAGSLPAQLEDQPISERHVEPELGQTNLMHGLVACGVGVAVVGVFLISYYYLAGVVAFFAVIMNLLIVLGVMAGLNATFTLPSIAGIVLSVGTAVDANVLIFERLREEQHRGLSLRMALRNAYDKAMSAILDSNATTFITSIFLIWFGTEEVKGFGITLVIGILASLFTALFVTRTIFGFLIDRVGIRQLRSLPLTFPKWDKLLKPNIKWMSFAWVFYTFSIIAISAGLVLFGIKVHQRQMFDIEFAGGTSVQFDLIHPVSKDQLQKQLQDSGIDVLKSANPVALGAKIGDSGYDSFDLLTPSTNALAVRDAVIKTLGPNLKLERPSTFTGVTETQAGVVPPLEKVLGSVVQPVNDKTKWPQVGGQEWRPETWADYKDGVLITLEHLDPPLTPGQIADRINRQLLQNVSGQQGQHRSFVVESPNKDRAQPTSLALVLSADPNLPYAKDPKQWDDLFAAPLWKNVVEGVDQQAQLKEVRNFDAQVAGDAQNNALLALTLSILVIMAYIWVRFGNLKYGTATMVALLHDTLFTIAALGFAHYAVNVPWLRSVFQLEPFRINLTVVAGILTIMGYSMIDTIVVFDRIRENRGKYGHVSRQVINDAVNQTLSRTLLTAGTTTITVAIMYFLGGQGIHGFTFVLLIGILVGTYSSVAIAAPLLLVGNKAPQQAPVSRMAARGQLQRA